MHAKRINGPSLMTRMRDLAQRPGLPWLLGFIMLGQILIPLQSHSRLAVDERGIVVEVCTLDGLSERTIYPGGEHPQPDDGDRQYSPAMVFSQLLAEALLNLAAVQPVWTSLAVEERPPATIGTLPPSFSHHTVIRAPPVRI